MVIVTGRMRIVGIVRVMLVVRAVVPVPR